MNIGIVGVAYGGYGRFIDEWLLYIGKSTIKPTQVTIVLGEGHGYTGIPTLDGIELKIVEDNNEPNLGRLTNLGIENTLTEWVMCIDIDDLILPYAISLFEKYEKRYDYLCIGWRINKKHRRFLRQSPLPIDIVLMPKEKRGKVRINNNSPFRRKFWETRKFDENKFFNLLFLAHMVENHAKFVKIPNDCIVYRQWKGSMVWNWLADKPNAREAILEMYNRFENYYL